MESIKSEAWERRHRVKCYSDDPDENEGTVTTPKSIWKQYPATTLSQWGAAASAAELGGQWINPAWTALETNAYWFGYYQHQRTILQHADSYWNKESYWERDTEE